MIYALIAAGAVLLVCLAAGFFFYFFALDSRRRRYRLEDVPPRRMLPFERDRSFIDTLSAETDETVSRDGLKLRALYKVNDPDKWIIICHGYNSRPQLMSLFAERFYGMGYSILLPYMRGHGESEGGYIGMGWHDRLDLIDWAKRVNTRFSPKGIGFFGLSMGAATVMMASGEAELPANVKFIIEDCGYSSVLDEFKYEMTHRFHLPAFPFLRFAALSTRIHAGFNFYREGSAVEQLKKSRTPTLFIHGDADTFVPFYMLERVWSAAACEKERLVVHGAAHAMSAWVEPELYWNTVESFARKHL